MAVITSAVVTVAATAYSAKQNSKARKAQKKANKLQEEQFAQEQAQRRLNQKRAAAEDKRNRLQSIRQAAIERARLVNSAELSGVGGSSSAEGAEASIGSQLAGNLGFAQQISDFANSISNRQIIAADFGFNAGQQLFKAQQAKSRGADAMAFASAFSGFAGSVGGAVNSMGPYSSTSNLGYASESAWKDPFR